MGSTKLRLPRVVILISSLALAVPAIAGSSGGVRRAGAAQPIRVFAIGYKHLIEDATSYRSYRAHLTALADAADPPGARAADAPAKVFVFPEDSALYAMFTGLRGLPFRTLEPLLRRGGGNGASVAVVGLIAAYQPQAAYYRLKFPQQNLSQARLGFLALTDTLYRSFFETFRSIAIAHKAWVVTAANIAPARITRDAATALLLGDPEARGRPCGDVPPPCAYEATSENVYNQAFVFDPSGTLVFNPFAPAREGDLDGAVKKTYLVPIEQGPVEQGKIGLDLSYGDLRQVRPVDIAGVPMGIVISKPAWMLDELGRLDAYGANVILQPEAFSSWGAPVEDWSPDVLKQSGWSHTQKYSSFRYSVLSELTGNFFDLIFDAQNHIVAKATSKSVGPLRYIGQTEDTGWTSVSPWVVSDGPGEACGAGDLVARRRCLARVAQALAPGSGDRRENGYVEPLVVGSLDLAAPAPDSTRAPAVLGAARRIDDAPTGARARNPSIASDPTGGRYVVWQDDRTGIDQVRVARIGIDGTIEPSRPIVERTGVRQIAPQIEAGASGSIHVVWQELDPVPRLRYAVAPGGKSPFTDLAIGTDLRAAEQWTPSLAVGDDGRAHVGWIGLIGGFERLAYSRFGVRRAEIVEETSRLLDDEAYPAPDPLALRLNNRWNPDIDVRGSTVAVAWTDFRNYAWDLFATVSRNGGTSFGPHLRVDDAARLGGAAATLERLHDDPVVRVAADGSVLIAWTDQAGRRAACNTCPQQRRPDSDIAFARLSPQASVFSRNARVDDTGDGLTNQNRAGFSAQWRPSLAEGPAGRLFAAWQDHREGNNDIYAASSEDGGRTWSLNMRIDDTGGGASNQYAPVLTVDHLGISVVWQDDRDGSDHVYVATGS